MNIGVICKSGASIIMENLNYFKKNNVNFNFVFDQKCPAIAKCKKNNITYKRFKYNSSRFKKIKTYLKINKIKYVILLYNKIVDENIYKNFNTFNIHPSYLPKYKGLNALNRQIQNKEDKIGCTLHWVNENIDAGKIIFQIKNRYNMKNYKNISYQQKVLIMKMLILKIINKKKFNNLKKKININNSKLKLK
jgi:folate-dependent phosphoribosylglycinamide formyltransferase PurN